LCKVLLSTVEPFEPGACFSDALVELTV